MDLFWLSNFIEKKMIEIVLNLSVLKLSICVCACICVCVMSSNIYAFLMSGKLKFFPNGEI